VDREETVTQDEQDLRLLSRLHFAVAGLTGLFSLLPVIYLIVGTALSEDTVVPLEFMLWILTAGSFVMSGLALATLMAFGGRALRQYEHYRFCVFVAAVSCLLFPFGTVLGGFTIIVLMRDTVREMFQSGANAASGHITSA
jgi:hypothetical protein